MKRGFILSFSIISISILCQGQGGWELVWGSDTFRNPGNVFMIDTANIWGAAGSSIYFSPDWGRSWERQFHNDDYQLSDVFFSDEENGWAVGWSEVIHTSDGGQTWELQSVPNPLGLDLEAVYFINPDTGWIAGSYKMIFVTYDGGDHWDVQFDYDLSGHYFYRDIHFYDENHGCAVGGGLISALPIIMTTEDGGENWTEIHPSGDHSLSKVQFVMDLLVYSCNSQGRLYRSWDAGFSWEELPLNPPVLGSDMHFFNEYEAVIGGNGSQLGVTSDAWVTNQHVELWTYNMFSCFSFTEDYSGIATGYDNVLITRDGGHTWKNRSDRFSRIGFFSPENGWIIPEHLNKFFLHTTDGGNTWTEAPLEHSGALLQMDIVNDQLAFAVTMKSELLKTSDAGETWEISTFSEDSAYYTDIQFVDENTGFLIKYPSTFLKTTDGGIEWDSIEFDTVNALFSIEFLDPSNGYLAGNLGYLARTQDGGNTWKSQIIATSGLDDISFVDPQNGYVVCAAGEIYRTMDGGDTWQALGTDFYYPENIFFFDQLNGWLTDKDRVYHTRNGGLDWDEELYTYAPKWEHGITGFFALDTSMAWICTMDGRVFRYDVTMGLPELSDKPEIMVYPNPARDFLYVEWNGKIEGEIQLSLYTMDGRDVGNFILQAEQGKTEALNISNYSAGIYILNFRGPHYSRNIKVVKNL